jgi:D-xylose 1-dehydrogenase
VPDIRFASYPSLLETPVVISGGATGIGEHLVREFAAQRSRVGFVDIAGEAGRRLEAELSQNGHSARFIECDITDVAAYQSAIRGRGPRTGFRAG